MRRCDVSECYRDLRQLVLGSAFLGDQVHACRMITKVQTVRSSRLTYERARMRPGRMIGKRAGRLDKPYKLHREMIAGSPEKHLNTGLMFFVFSANPRRLLLKHSPTGFCLAVRLGQLACTSAFSSRTFFNQQIKASDGFGAG